ARTHWVPVVIIGIIYAIVYFFLFHWIIKKFDLDTPGRKADTSLHTKEEFRNKNALNGLSENDQRAYQIVSGLGGTDNLVDVDNCATR
ncbi:PTS transporter subunit EIIB, partial [Streptococcus oralis]